MRWLPTLVRYLAVGLSIALATVACGISDDVAQTPTSVASARIITQIETNERVVALTFDADADGGHTGEILATLRAHGVRASIAVSGLWAETNPTLVNSIAAEGHEFVNHGYSARSFTGASTGSAPLSAEERALELSRTETTVYRLTNRETRPFARPPYGDVDEGVAADVARAGYDYIVLWSVDPGSDGVTAVDIADRALALAAPGAIYRLPLGGEAADAAALGGIIAGLRAQGYRFVTVSELIALE